MVDFRKILNETLSNEGGYSFDPNDDGGETLFGIARAKNPQWAGWKQVDAIVKAKGFDKHNKNHWDDIAAACKSIDSVEAFYRIDFWNVMKGDSIGSYAVARSMFDFGVNSGIKTSIKIVQRVIGVVDDGNFGPKSLASLNNYITTKPAYDFHKNLLLRKLQRYVKIVEADSEDIKYIFGWTSRSFEYIENLFNLKEVAKTEPFLLELYKFVLDGRNSVQLEKILKNVSI